MAKHMDSDIAHAPTPAHQYRCVIITDMTHDDGNSLIRLLHYANEIDIAAVIVSPQGPEADKHPNWGDSIEAKAQRIIDSYEQTVEALRQHDPAYPSADYFRSITKMGLKENAPTRMTGSDDLGQMKFADYVGEGLDSEGSDFLQDVFEAPDERPLFVAFWGGPWTFVQALYRFRQKHTEEQYQALMNNMLFHCIDFQDVTFDYFLSLNTFNNHTAKTYYGDFDGTRVMPALLAVDTGHYWSYIGNVDPEEVKRRSLHMGDNYDGGGEGDTPSILNLISMNLGLSDVRHPEWGGWGDMFHPLEAMDNVWLIPEQRDELDRWVGAATNDFFARCQWGHKPPSECNHAPVAVVNGDSSRDIMVIDCRGGTVVELDASASYDPDGDALRFKWFRYHEADSYTGEIVLEANQSPKIAITVPADIGQQSLHLVVEVSDNGSPNLVAYRRVVLHSQPQA